MSAPQYYGNLQFVGVARIEMRQGIIIASHAYNSEADLDGVRKVLEQPTTGEMEAGTHYSIPTGSLTWHLTKGLNIIIVIVIRIIIIIIEYVIKYNIIWIMFLDKIYIKIFYIINITI